VVHRTPRVLNGLIIHQMNSALQLRQNDNIVSTTTILYYPDTRTLFKV